MEIRVIRAIRVLLNIEILVFLGLNIYKGACMSTTIHQTKSYLYLPDTNNYEYELLAHYLCTKYLPLLPAWRPTCC